MSFSFCLFFTRFGKGKGKRISGATADTGEQEKGSKVWVVCGLAFFSLWTGELLDCYYVLAGRWIIPGMESLNGPFCHFFATFLYFHHFNSLVV